MKPKKANKLSKEDLLKIDLAVQRESRIKQGFFDGRFKNKVQTSKKVYNRQKNKKIGFSEDNSSPIFLFAV